ncbi:MAG: transglutaminase-like cysteine peptidase [Campylobacterales bacterium]|nr:transglutaminase-like cysteine peptidase [Campylobacterales bacterium]
MRWFGLWIGVWMLCSLGAGQVAFTSKAVEAVVARYGEGARQRIEAYDMLIGSLADRDEFEKLIAVNVFVNRALWVSDRQLWGEEDYWASPLEFLGRNAGDCEDYVIAKYFALRRSGVADTKLFFTYVKASGQTQPHMVLSYYPTPSAVPLVLDNLNAKILPGTLREDLTPVYSFNASTLFLAKKAGKGERLPGSERQNKAWFDFLANLEKERL